MDSSLPGSAVHGDFQARILEWAAISFSRGRPGISGTKEREGPNEQGRGTGPEDLRKYEATIHLNT